MTSLLVHRRQLSLCHVKTLKMSDDVLSICHSPDGRLLAVALLDTTVKIFFIDTLKVVLCVCVIMKLKMNVFQFFLSLYGHKLPVLSMDISSVRSLRHLVLLLAVGDVIVGQYVAGYMFR